MLNTSRSVRWIPCFVLAAWLHSGMAGGAPADELPVLREIQVKSRKDGSLQPSLIWTPEKIPEAGAPVLIFLHSWSGDYQQKNDLWLKGAAGRGWIYLHPNFRGRNRSLQACGSAYARQDILDALDEVLAKYRVDRSRIYLAGTSGGGHMAMLMAGYHPNRFSAVSAWVGISDLAEWHRFHTRTGKPDNYALDIVASCGGAPGASAQVDAEYRERSPLFHIQNAVGLPLDLNAGVTDGKTGSVPIRHTLLAYNVVAKAGNHATISEKEMAELSEQERLSSPQSMDTAADETYGRAILLRRTAGEARVTIFQGGHEGLPAPAISWLAKQQRKTTPSER